MTPARRRRPRQRRSTSASTPSPARSPTSPAARHGAVWVGNVPSLADTAAVLGIRDPSARPSSPPTCGRSATVEAAVLTGFDAGVDALLPRRRAPQLAQVIDELRLIKDDWEIGRLRYACDVTARGFADVVRELPDVRRPRPTCAASAGSRARSGGAPGSRATRSATPRSSAPGAHAHDAALVAQQRRRRTRAAAARRHGRRDRRALHRRRHPHHAGRRRVDAGRSCGCTAPCYEAQAAGIAEVKAGADFLAAHRAAMWVLADHLHCWGVLPVPAEVVLRRRPGAARRRPAPPLHAARHLAHARHRRARLRAGARRGLPRRHARRRATCSPSSRACTSSATT